MKNLKPVDFNLMEVGEELGPVKLRVDEHFLKWYSFSVDDYTPFFKEEKTPQAAILLCDLLRLLYTKYDPDRDLGLHQKEEVEFFSPLSLGEEVELKGKFIDKYVKRDKVYFVTEATAHSTQDGRLIIKHIAIETADINSNYKIGGGTAKREEEKKWIDTELPRDVIPVRNINRLTPLNSPLIGPIKQLHQDQISLFSGAQKFWKGIHTDIDIAKAAGFKDTVAQGLMETCYVSEWATELFGKEWYYSGKISMSFLNAVFPKDILSIEGILKSIEKEEGGERAEIHMWLKNQEDKIVAVGWFSSLLPSDTKQL